MAGLDGIQNKIDPGDPLDKDIYSLSPEELESVPHVPASLEEALEALEADHSFLLKGDVFTKDVIQMWLDYKIKRELTPCRMHPTPMEYYLYYDT
jgi:glutamine synthetase